MDAQRICRVRERHIGHFVLKYVVNENAKTVTIVDYDHHE